MTEPPIAAPSPDSYIGRILCQSTGTALSTHLVEWLSTLQALDRMGSPAMPYLAAWQTQCHTIWYEFVGRRIVELLDCAPEDAARAFQEALRERRVYISDLPEGGIGEKVWDSGEIQGHRNDLRREVQEAGRVEAVYRIEPPSGRVLWLKDVAAIYPFESEDIVISLGNLTDVSKEMEQEQALKATKEALWVSEQKYRYQACHDNLTDLFNTRHLYKALNRLKEAYAADAKVFSLIFFDIDNFKKVVDTHGHLLASRVIQEVALAIKAVIEPPAFGVAYAGDEFVVVLPDHDKAQALQMAERIRERIRHTVFLESHGLCVQIRASFGVAAFPDDTEDLTRLLSLADQAMFRVKTDGKDSVRASRPETV